MISLKEKFEDFDGKVKSIQDVTGFSLEESQEMCRIALKWAEISPIEVSEAINYIHNAINGSLDLLNSDLQAALNILSSTTKRRRNRNRIRANERKSRFKCS